jgi:hypothetical protein
MDKNIIELNKSALRVVSGGTRYQLSDNCICETKARGFLGFVAFGNDNCVAQCAAFAKQQMTNTNTALTIAAACVGVGCAVAHKN